MQRREFITLVGGAAATWPLAARAQNTNKAPRRIAFLPDVYPATLEAWRADMRVLGWIEGQDFTLRGLVAELAERGLKVDYRTVWSFVHDEKLSFKKKRGGWRTRSPRRGAAARPVDKVSKPRRT